MSGIRRPVATPNRPSSPRQIAKAAHCTMKPPTGLLRISLSTRQCRPEFRRRPGSSNDEKANRPPALLTFRVSPDLDSDSYPVLLLSRIIGVYVLFRKGAILA